MCEEYSFFLKNIMLLFYKICYLNVNIDKILNVFKDMGYVLLKHNIH